jgi:Na+/phosphate symporter
MEEKENSKRQSNKKWYDTHKEYFAEKIECEYCHRKIKRSHMSRHHLTQKCIETRRKNVDMLGVLEQIRDALHDIVNVLKK